MSKFDFMKKEQFLEDYIPTEYHNLVEYYEYGGTHWVDLAGGYIHDQQGFHLEGTIKSIKEELQNVRKINPEELKTVRTSYRFERVFPSVNGGEIVSTYKIELKKFKDIQGIYVLTTPETTEYFLEESKAVARLREFIF